MLLLWMDAARYVNRVVAPTSPDLTACAKRKVI
jgi:hypothetical protein